MTELEVVNLMLTEGAGQDPVNSVEEGDETTARVKNVFDRVLKDALASPWPFNEDTVDLLLQTDGTVKIPTGIYLWVELPDGYVVREGKVYKPKEQSYQVGRSFTNTKVAMNLSIDKLDHTVASWIAWDAAYQYAAGRDPSSARTARCRGEMRLWEKRMSVKFPAQIANDNPMLSISDARAGISSIVRRAGLDW